MALERRTSQDRNLLSPNSCFALGGIHCPPRTLTMRVLDEPGVGANGKLGRFRRFQPEAHRHKDPGPLEIGTRPWPPQRPPKLRPSPPPPRLKAKPPLPKRISPSRRSM